MIFIDSIFSRFNKLSLINFRWKTFSKPFLNVIFSLNFLWILIIHPSKNKNHFRAFDVKASKNQKPWKCVISAVFKKSSFLVILHEILLTLKCFMLEHERDFCGKKTMKTFFSLVSYKKKSFCIENIKSASHTSLKMNEQNRFKGQDKTSTCPDKSKI